MEETDTGAGMRLTRRGRAVLVGAVAALLVAGLWLGAGRGAGAASRGGGPAAHRSEWVVAGPRDTLWGIAVRTRPGVDPRVTVQRMIDLNSLDDGIIHPGQKLYLPSG